MEKNLWRKEYVADNYPEEAGHGSGPPSEVIASSRGMDNDPDARTYDSYDWDAEGVDHIIKLINKKKDKMMALKGWPKEVDLSNGIEEWWKKRCNYTEVRCIGSTRELIRANREVLDAQLGGDGQHLIRHLFAQTQHACPVIMQNIVIDPNVTSRFYNEVPMKNSMDKPHNETPGDFYEQAHTGEMSCFRLHINKAKLAQQEYNKEFASNYAYEQNRKSTTLTGIYTVMGLYTAKRRRWSDEGRMSVYDISHWAAVSLP